jgi:hypothetical protein
MYQEDEYINGLNAGQAVSGTDILVGFQDTGADEAVTITALQLLTYMKLALLAIAPRIVKTTTNTNHAPDCDSTDIYMVTAQNSNFTIDNPVGTPSNGQRLEMRITSTAAAHTITMGANYRFSGSLPAPATTTSAKTAYWYFEYNTDAVKWDVVRILDNF